MPAGVRRPIRSVIASGPDTAIPKSSQTLRGQSPPAAVASANWQERRHEAIVPQQSMAHIRRNSTAPIASSELTLLYQPLRCHGGPRTNSLGDEPVFVLNAGSIQIVVENSNAVEYALFNWRPGDFDDAALRKGGTGSSGAPNSPRSTSRDGNLHLPTRLLLGAGRLCLVRQI